MRFFALFYLYLLFVFPLQATDLKKVSLQLQWKYQFQFAGYIMAKEKGFYKDAGLDVEIKEWHNPINSVDELISNRAQYAILRPTAMIDIAKGKELVFLSAIYQSSPLILLADKSANITSIKDFNNKKIMTTGDLNSDASLLSMMFSHGVNIEKVNIIEPSFDVKDLMNKKADLMASYISNEPFVLKENGGTPVIFNPKDYGYDFYNDLVSVSKEYMTHNKEEVEEFRKATLKGWEYAFGNIYETVEVLHTQYNSQKKSKPALTYEAQELKKLAYAGTAKIGLIEKGKLEKIYDIYKLLGLAQSDINYNTIIYNHLSVEVNLSKSEKEYLKQKKNIKVCIDPSWMPFEQFDTNGKYKGMTAEYYKLFENFLGTHFEVVTSKSWAESLELAQKRECDILSLAMETPERKKYLNFTTPYISVPLVVATKSTHSFVADIEDLKGKKIGITKGYAYVELLKNKYSFLTLVEIENLDTGLAQVKSGELDGYIDTLASIAYSLQAQYGGELKVAGKFDEVWELGIGVRNDDATLLSILQKAVNNLQDDQRREILNKWISIKFENEIDYTLIWKVVGISFIIIVIILIIFLKEKALKNKLQEQKDEFETIFYNSKDGIAILDLDSNFVNCNNEYLQMTGFTKEELLQTSCIKLTIPEDIEKSKEVVREVIETGFVQNFEKTCMGKEDKRITVNMSLSLMPDKKRILISTKDVTYLKQLASKMKLLEMNEMMGNIAHQWRQPLSVISVVASSLILRSEYGNLEKEEIETNMNRVLEQTNYLSKTIDDFRNLIDGTEEASSLNIASIVREALVGFEMMIQDTPISLIVNLNEDYSIYGNKSEFEQVILYILNNAKDAVLSRKNGEKLIFINTQNNEGHFELEILDNGGGISNHIMDRIFEPYFTTKHQSIGTGLGLSTVDKVIRQKYNFTIQVYNKDYEHNGIRYTGCCFKIIF
jgi:polar amino acid transport system substrate-binding protein